MQRAREPLAFSVFSTSSIQRSENVNIIDPNKPLELSDGTSVEVVPEYYTPFGSRQIIRVNVPVAQQPTSGKFGKLKAGQWNYYAENGVWVGDDERKPTYSTLRNVTEVQNVIINIDFL